MGAGSACALLEQRAQASTAASPAWREPRPAARFVMARVSLTRAKILVLQQIRPPLISVESDTPVSTLWISKSGAVTLVTSLTLHAAAAVFMRGHDARGPATSAAPSLMVAVEVDQPLAVEAVPEPPRQAEPIPSAPVRVVASHAGGAQRRTEAAVAAPAPTPLVEATSGAPARFVMSTSVAARAVTLAPSELLASAVGRVSEGTGTAPLDATEVSVPARLLARAPVVYPPEARAQEIETDVRVEIVIDAVGRVVAARTLAKAGYNLDEAAVQAIRRYRFSPAKKDGRAVSVRMRWTVQFRLG